MSQQPFTAGGSLSHLMKRGAWRVGLIALLALAAAVLGQHATARAHSTDTGFLSVSDASVTPLVEGGASVHVAAVPAIIPSYGIVLTPDPSIDWGDGNSTGPKIGCTVTGGCTKYTGGDLLLYGDHNYGSTGTYHITLTYNTGCCIAYSTSWDATINAQRGTLAIYLRGAGAGTVSYSPEPLLGGPTCSGDCQVEFTGGQSVVLTATPASGSTFAGWSFQACGRGSCPNPCPGTSTCTQTTPPTNQGGVRDVYVTFNSTPTDKTPPVTTSSPATDTLSNGPVSVTLTATDPTVSGEPTSGVKEIHFSTVGTPITAPNVVAGNSFSLTISNAGRTEISYLAVDNQGNSESVKILVITIDNTKPRIIATATTVDNGQTYHAGTWANQAVAVAFTCADDPTGSGVSTNTVAGATVSNETRGQTVTNTGQCTDKAGNIADAASFGPIQIDRTPPVITAAATTADGKPYVAGAWTNQAVTVAFTCADTGSVQSGIFPGSVTGSTLTSDTAAGSVPGNGSCADKAGNQATPVTFGPVQIDTKKPVITASATTADGKSYVAGTWTNQAVTVSFACADTGTVQSGLAVNTVGGQTLSTDAASQMVSNTGICTDNAGNSAAAASFGPVQVDRTKPQIKVTAVTKDGKPYIAGAWTNQDVSVSFTCADTGAVQSGIVTNTVAGKTISIEGDTQSVTNTGSCIDAAGNSADSITLSGIRIDKTPPTCTVALTPKSIWPPNHKLKAVTATVTVKDLLSGTAGFILTSVKASGDANDIHGFTTGTASISGQVVANKGETYTFVYQASDRAGNTATCTGTVAVPHDQGDNEGNDQGNNDGNGQGGNNQGHGQGND